MFVGNCRAVVEQKKIIICFKKPSLSKSTRNTCSDDAATSDGVSLLTAFKQTKHY